MKFVIIYLIIINALAFVLMLVDKYKAQNNLWRIPEATLMTVAAIGGSFGAYTGMRICRHKTRHYKFSIGVPIMMVLHSLILWDIAQHL